MLGMDHEEADLILSCIMKKLEQERERQGLSLKEFGALRRRTHDRSEGRERAAVAKRVDLPADGRCLGPAARGCAERYPCEKAAAEVTARKGTLSGGYPQLF